MAASPDHLLAYLAKLGIATDSVEHPPVNTVEEARALRGTIPGGHTKNLFVIDRKRFLFLLVALEDAIIDLKRVHEVIGAQGRISFGSAELLKETWGVKPGSVTPFGAINDTSHRVKVVLEARMMASDRLNFHPLINTRTIGLRLPTSSLSCAPPAISQSLRLSRRCRELRPRRTRTALRIVA